MANDDFADRVKRQILDAYGFAGEAELDTAIEEELPGYLAAEAEYEARREAYLAELPDRVQEATAKVTELLRAQGMLPSGVEFELAPMDLEADPKWIAQVPKWWARGEPIVVDYATDRPFGPLVPLNPNAPMLTEEQKRAAAEAASARIEQWQKQRETGVLGNPGCDQPRSHDYPAGG
jgi:hypothetical protein